MVFIIYFKKVVPKDDYILDIYFDDGSKMNFSMTNLIKQFRFSPLKNHDVWINIDLFPTHLEWNKGNFQTTLNLEEIVIDCLHKDNK